MGKIFCGPIWTKLPNDNPIFIPDGWGDPFCIHHNYSLWSSQLNTQAAICTSSVPFIIRDKVLAVSHTDDVSFEWLYIFKVKNPKVSTSFCSCMYFLPLSPFVDHLASVWGLFCSYHERSCAVLSLKRSTHRKGTNGSQVKSIKGGLILPVYFQADLH